MVALVEKCFSNKRTRPLPAKHYPERSANGENGELLII